MARGASEVHCRQGVPCVMKRYILDLLALFVKVKPECQRSCEDRPHLLMIGFERGGGETKFHPHDSPAICN